MLKLILVYFILTDRNTVSMEYAVRYNTEAECQAAKNKIEAQTNKRSMFSSEPIRGAVCVMEITPRSH